MIKIKEGVQFTYSPGGLTILNAIKAVSRMLQFDLTITSGNDGIHFDGSAEFRNSNTPNPDDPHYHGDAYDVRSHDLPNELVKQQVLANLNNILPRDKFYYLLENPATINEHFHIQVKKGTKFTIQDFLSI